MPREVVKATAWGLAVTIVLALLIVVGSRRLAHFDAALVAYTVAILFATFGLTYRYSMWLQRPPTAVYWKRGWQTFFAPKHFGRNLVAWVRYVFGDILGNRFILNRSRMRGIAHLLIMWGCILAIAITFPLVFGWLHFESPSGDLENYTAFIFGFRAFTFPVDSLFAFLMFHGLVWSAFFVIGGVMIAMRRRMRDESAAAVQIFTEDFLPLLLLFAVSISGLMLTASYTWLSGYAYEFIAIFHAVTVIVTFLWLPFGKFFHIFQRPAQIGVRFYKEVGEHGEPAHCRRCGQPFTSLLHVNDLIYTEKALGYAYEIPHSPDEHYQWFCPPCRRAAVALAQTNLLQAARGWPQAAAANGTAANGAAANGAAATAGPPTIGSYTPSTPVYVNSGAGEGPLGHEDARNYHP